MKTVTSMSIVEFDGAEAGYAWQLFDPGETMDEQINLPDRIEVFDEEGKCVARYTLGTT